MLYKNQNAFLVISIFSILFIFENICAQTNKSSAIVFWNGVNGNWAAKNHKYKYAWQMNADYLVRSVEKNNLEYAKPFEVNAKFRTSTVELTNNLRSYLDECKASGQKPVVVFIPKLNIVEYALTINPVKTSLPTLYSEAVIVGDKKWSQTVTPVVMKELSESGYNVNGYAHSWGGQMAVEGIKSSSTAISKLTVINARAFTSDLDNLKVSGKVESLTRITTASDAWTYPGKASYGKGDIHVVDLKNFAGEKTKWGNVSDNHSFFLNDPATKVTVEVGGNKTNTTLKELLSGKITDGFTKTAGGESGVSMQIELNQQSIKKDTAGELNLLKNKILNERVKSDSLYWPLK